MSEHIAIKNKDEITYTDAARAVCDGPLVSKHPRVYLNTGAEGHVVCPYCSHVFVKR